MSNGKGYRGSISWPSDRPVWEFDYWMSVLPDAEGIVLWNVRFKKRLLLYKASLPMIRVDYDNGYKSIDHLDLSTAYPLVYSPPNSTFVKVKEEFSSERKQRCLTLASFHEGGVLGAYRINHKWILYEDGVIKPRLFSAGVNGDRAYSHRHHVYWRLDFDIEGFADDVILEHFITGTSHDRDEQGFGVGWSQIMDECAGKRIKDSQFDVYWAVMDRKTGRGCRIHPGAHDGFADPYSPGDLWAMRYHPEEDTHGRIGSPTGEDRIHDEGLPKFMTCQTQPHGQRITESLDRQDIVVWYCAHIYHAVDEDHMHGDEYHGGGPWLIPFRYD